MEAGGRENRKNESKRERKKRMHVHEPLLVGSSK
jgi:hypothetical protein